MSRPGHDKRTVLDAIAPAHRQLAERLLRHFVEGVDVAVAWPRLALSLEEATVQLSIVVERGPEETVLTAFDRVFRDDGWILRLRTPLPTGIDTAPILQSLRLWFTARTMASDTPDSVTYDHEDVSLEFTVCHELGAGRVLTLGSRSRLPAEALDAALGDGAADIVLFAPWHRFARHAVQAALYGPVKRVDTDGVSYVAEVDRGGWFAAHPEVAEVWWLDAPRNPTLVRLTNPWATGVPCLLRPGRACEAQAHNDGATLRWVRGGGG